MEKIQNLRKKLLYQSWHRGCKETDILLGDFAKANIDSFSEKELHDYTKLVETDDSILFNWLTEKEKIPANLNTTVYKKLVNFHASKNI